MGVSDDQPKSIAYTRTTWVEFNNPRDCEYVHHLMTHHKMIFQEAIDYAELRPNYHFVFVTEETRDE